jgi:hypothetical protein
MSQSSDILKALRSGISITPMFALTEFGCFRLAARVHDLRQSGYPIKGRDRTLQNGKVVTEYWMEPDTQGILL